MTVPGAPTGVQVSYDEDRVKIDWTSPAFTGGFQIALTSYKVEAMGNSSDIYLELACQESQASMILLGAPTCSIQMLSLLETPYNLVQGSQIKVRITAANVLGLGYTSLVSTSNVQVRVLPKKPIRDTYRG